MSTVRTMLLLATAAAAQNMTQQNSTLAGAAKSDQSSQLALIVSLSIATPAMLFLITMFVVLCMPPKYWCVCRQRPAPGDAESSPGRRSVPSSFFHSDESVTDSSEISSALTMSTTTAREPDYYLQDEPRRSAC